MNIYTNAKTNAKGVAQIVAKGNGKQRTVPVDPTKSSDWNHGTAAGTLAEVIGFGWREGIEHRSTDDGIEHIFIWI